MSTFETTPPPRDRLGVLVSWSIPVLAGFAALAGVISFYELQRLILQCSAFAVIVQAVLIGSRIFRIGWFELFAYTFHAIFIGASCTAVAFDLLPFPHGSSYEKLALIGLAGQFVIGYLALTSSPLPKPLEFAPTLVVWFTVICCTAAVIKFYYYYQAVGSLGGHLAIYTEGDQLRDSSPIIIRILSAAAPFAGLLALTQRGIPWWCRVMGLFAIGIEFAIGTRGRPLFLLAAALVLVQHRIRLSFSTRVLLVCVAIAVVVGAIAIGYVREDYNLTFDQYLVITLNSLFSTFEAAALGANLQVRELVLTQIKPLVFPTDLLSVDTVSKAISSSLAYQAYIRGFGLSSSALLEVVMVVGPAGACMAYPVFVVAVLKIVRSALTSKSAMVYLIGLGILPISYYIWRAELWQFVVPLIKALPFLLAVAIVNGHFRSLIKFKGP